jgi:transcription factor TGA
MQMLLSHVEPLTEQQIVGVYGLQQSALETEEALSQGLDALYQSLSDAVVSDALSCPSNVANYMGQMAAAMNKLSTLEGFVRQVTNKLITSRSLRPSIDYQQQSFHLLQYHYSSAPNSPSL